MIKKSKGKKLILGLDLGITSVGYGIIEADTYEIIAYGVRLFEEGTADNNLTRRTMRGGRRLKSRRQNRIAAIKHLLINNEIVEENFPILNNVYELRVKGLTSKLSNVELANVLVNMAKRRGSSLDVAVDDTNKEATASASSLTKNTTELQKRNMYICELQLEKIQKGIKLRDSDNVYRLCDYIKELKQILSNQELPVELNEKIINIIKRRRDFSNGPGSKEFPTPYGSYRLEKVDGKDEVIKVNLIEVMKGKCSIFKDEPRIAKCTYEACLFNFLNDLNNIKINEKEKITPEQKKKIIDEFINPKGKITLKQLYKLLNVTEEQVSGLRVNISGKKLLTTFDVYAKLLSILPAEITQDKDLVDRIIEILTKTQVVEQRKNEILKLVNLEQPILDELVNLTRINEYHSLSKKAMDIIIPEMIESDKNQMQIINDNKLGDSEEKYLGANIPFDENAILSPVAKRVHIQALKVVNELRHTYGEFDSIVIETTRAKNSNEEKMEYQIQQKRFEEEKKRVNELLLDIDKNPDAFNTKTKLKLRLYKEQDGRTMYAGLPIDLDTLLNDETAYQIEHIIPYAVSFDNKMSNKALASAKENQDKGKRTPWQYFSTGKVSECGGQFNTWDEYESFVNSLKISQNKKKNLLNQEDITKFDNMKEFVDRNLNDTSYGIRTVMNTMKKYFNDNNIETKVFTIKGRITNDFRKRVGLKKDRDIYIHHAIDALIIAGSKNQKVFRNAYELCTKNDTSIIVKTGEVFDYSQDPFDDSRFLQFISSLKCINGDPTDFSYMVDRKTNRSFVDQTIYSTRLYDGENYIIKKYKDIYGADGAKLKKLFDDKKSENLLVYKNDIKTYEIIKKIYESYPNESNPFLKYKLEFGEPIRKYSKSSNGPIISQLKLIDSKLGNCLDISKNYNLDDSDKKVVLLSISPYRTDIYISPKGVYKMLTVRRHHVKKVNGLNIIDENQYQELKKEKNITDNDGFLFSLNRHDFINIITTKDMDNLSGKNFYRFIGTKNDSGNVIEVKKINMTSDKRITFTIGKSIAVFEKYNVSPAGRWSKADNEVLKLSWK